MLNGKWNVPSSAGNKDGSQPGHRAQTFSIRGVNQLSEPEKRTIYQRLIPAELLTRFAIPESFVDAAGRPLLNIKAAADSAALELTLFHEFGFPDPIFYGHITDSLVGQIHILLYVLNDPAAPRFDTDCLSSGQSTQFGTACRNLQAEAAALGAGLSPGQVRRGLGILKNTTQTFEKFVSELGHDLYFADPLFYHNAVIFERYGFAYEKGRKLMEKIHQRFSPEGEYICLLDGSSPFRQPEAAQSIRLRSWAILDGVMGEPYTNVTMYKRIGHYAEVNTCPGIAW